MVGGGINDLGVVAGAVGSVYLRQSPELGDSGAARYDV